MMIFRPLVALGLILALATAAADAAGKPKSSFKKPTHKAHHIHGVIVNVDEHHITIRTHHHKKKKSTTAAVAGGAKKHHHHHTFKIHHSTTVNGMSGPQAIASLHPHDHVSIKAEEGVAKHIHKGHHHAKKKKKK
jgi:hypothetical protein